MLDGLARVLETYAGKSVVVVSHVTPIKILVAHAVDAPLSALFRMELSTASVSVVSFFGGPEVEGAGERGHGSRSGARCACTTPNRPAPGRCSTPSAGSAAQPGMPAVRAR